MALIINFKESLVREEDQRVGNDLKKELKRCLDGLNKGQLKERLYRVDLLGISHLKGL